MRSMWGCLIGLSLLTPVGFGAVIFVDDDAPLGGDGQAWTTAYKHLQDGLYAAMSGDEIHVAGGRYTPDLSETGIPSPGDRAASFQLANGIGIYGGYAGWADSGTPDARDVALYATILSGDLLDDDDPNDLLVNRGDNSNHVLITSGTDSTALLDGCTVSGGFATMWGAAIYNRGGSPVFVQCTFRSNRGSAIANILKPNPTVYSNPTLHGCVFEQNGGDAAFLNDGGSPRLTNCRFVGNLSGGMYNWDGDPTLVDCEFANNTADYGGGMGGEDGNHATLINCTFRNNSATVLGGALYSGLGDHPTLVNCRFYGNSASQGGALGSYWGGEFTLDSCTFAANSAPVGKALCFQEGAGVTRITNCILWDGDGEISNDGAIVDIRYSDVFGGSSGAGNINMNPLFVDPGQGDVRLSVGSPCIDAGDNLSVARDVLDIDADGCVTEPIPVDLDGHVRYVDDPGRPDTGAGAAPIIDMGAYEYGSTTPPAPDGHCAGDLDCDGAVNFADINPFVLALSNPAAWQAAYPDCNVLNGDINNNGLVGFDDINPFVTLLSTQ